jgi:hypothetical protein
MAVCQIYAEVELADLPVHEGKEARGWLTSAHKDAECAREHIGARIRRSEELRMLLYPAKKSSSRRAQQKKQAPNAAYREAKGASAKFRQQAQGAADQARLQASRTPEAATEFPGNKPGEVSFTRPRDRNEETVAQGTFMWEGSPSSSAAGAEARCNHRMDAEHHVTHIQGLADAEHQAE